jgi:hypothetical protein
MISLRKVTASVTIALAALLGIQTPAMAEYDVNSALQAYDSSDPANRKIWELIPLRHTFDPPIEGSSWSKRLCLRGKLGAL